ncbi:ABC transporter permease [Paenibacillus kobensis]|uniref:ABC transporter permease n=1 Tax=Paenibacillus kobensis TaxID=59841 RepID=UPI000FD8926F|nr:ABC transporter permease [Paenibacillus kobensis]
MIKSLIYKEVLVIFKEKGTFFWLFLLPIFFIVIFALIFGNQKTSQTVHYYDADRTAASQQLIETMQSTAGFDLKYDSKKSLDSQLASLKNGKITALLVIPEGFEASLNAADETSPTSLKLYRDASADMTIGPIKALLNNVVSIYKDQKITAALKESGQTDVEASAAIAPPIEIQDVAEKAFKNDSVTQYVPGYTIMFVFFIMTTMINSFMRDRGNGMLSRLRSTPMQPIHYLIGMWIPNIIVVIVQCTVLLLFGKIVFGMHLGNLFALFSVVFILSICATGLGLMISMVSSNENIGNAFVQIFTMGGAIVGGLWYPWDLLPEFARKIGVFLPHHWAQDSLQNIMIRGANVEDVWQGLLILLAYGVAGLVIALLRFKKFITSSVS